jgi:hypothetical protein
MQHLPPVCIIKLTALICMKSARTINSTERVAPVLMKGDDLDHLYCFYNIYTYCSKASSDANKVLDIRNVVFFGRWFKHNGVLWTYYARKYNDLMMFDFLGIACSYAYPQYYTENKRERYVSLLPILYLLYLSIVYLLSSYTMYKPKSKTTKGKFKMVSENGSGISWNQSNTVVHRHGAPRFVKKKLVFNFLASFHQSRIRSSNFRETVSKILDNIIKDILYSDNISASGMQLLYSFVVYFSIQYRLDSNIYMKWLADREKKLWKFFIKQWIQWWLIERAYVAS